MGETGRLLILTLCSLLFSMFLIFTNTGIDRRIDNVLKPILPKPKITKSFQKGCHDKDSEDLAALTRNLIVKDIFKSGHGSKRPVVVAVVDTGMSMSHPDLAPYLWTNPGESGLDKHGQEKASNKIDDDQNGFIDDVHGWNFSDNNNDLSDQHGHGTHIAGLIKSSSDDGDLPHTQIMVLKYYSPIKSDNLEMTIKAFNYAVKMKAEIINYSGGGDYPSPAEYEAVRSANYAGILFVAAAGNERANTDMIPFYPADYDLDNIVSVTAVNPQLRILASSNYGRDTVDIAAPGEDLCSTLPPAWYGSMTGTSQAAAIVSGTAALLLARGPKILPSELKILLVASAKRTNTLEGKAKSRGMIDIEKAAWLLNYLGEGSEPSK